MALIKRESSIPVPAEGYDRRIFLNVPAQYYMGAFHRACPVFQICCVSVNKDLAFYSFPYIGHSEDKNDRCCKMLSRLKKNAVIFGFPNYFHTDLYYLQRENLHWLIHRHVTAYFITPGSYKSATYLK